MPPALFVLFGVFSGSFIRYNHETHETARNKRALSLLVGTNVQRGVFTYRARNRSRQFVGMRPPAFHTLLYLSPSGTLTHSEWML